MKAPVDNLELLLDFIQPTSPDDFYYLQILQRKKENPQLGRNSRVIKNYYITSQENLLKRWDEIKELCQQFNARASLRLNKRSYERVAFKALKKMAEQMEQRDYSHVGHAYDAAIGNGHNDKDKKWILDIDAKEGETSVDMGEVMKVMDFITNIEPFGFKQLAIIPSKTGMHIITKPFNLEVFSKEYPDIDIHKDNPVNLYIPIIN